MSAQSKSPAKPARHAQRKPWKEAHQMALSGTIVVLIVASIIVGIGWRDGYWASSTATVTKGKGP